MIVLAIDPGNTHSAFVVYDGATVLDHGKLDNQALLARLRADLHVEIVPFAVNLPASRPESLAIEMAESFGTKVWNQVFLAMLWAGRFVQAFGGPVTLMSRLKVKTHVTGSARSKDQQVRQCLLERWGGKEQAVGTKASKGPLFGVTADRWAALAIAVAHAEGAGVSAVHAQLADFATKEVEG